MGKNDDGHFWGMVLAAAAVAIAGAVALTRSFRTSRDGGRTWEGPAQGKDRPKPDRMHAGDQSQKPTSFLK